MDADEGLVLQMENSHLLWDFRARRDAAREGALLAVVTCF